MIEKVNKAYSILGIIKRNYYLDTNSFVLFYKAMVRPHLYMQIQSGARIKREILKLLKRYKKELLN